MLEFTNLPPQQLSFKQKTKEWRKKHLDWADSKTVLNSDTVRKSVYHKRINYDLLNGKIHMNDIELLLNPYNIQANFIPETIQHYPIINSKLNVLRGEESKRVFDYKVIVTNPTAISEIEQRKKEQLLQVLQEEIANESQSEEEYQANIEKHSKYFTYEWQDQKEVEANYFLNHYVKEYNIPYLFNKGFVDAAVVGEEIYQCDIEGGEPTIKKLDPNKVRIFKSGYSSKIEDADIIVIEDYLSPGQIIDRYYDVLTPRDIKYIENLPKNDKDATNSQVDETLGFVRVDSVSPMAEANGFYFDPFNLFNGPEVNDSLPYDVFGNVKVLKVYWKSRRKIKKVKSFDPNTGEEVFTFYPETHKINPLLGEEEQIMWINEAWEGTKIGDKIYVEMRPRPIQYNRLSNPSRCHFGIIGSVYNTNGDKPFSLVDMMKPFSYTYDVIHARLNKLLANNMGKLIKLDLALVPKGWTIDKWMYYMKTNNIVVTDSFKEGDSGMAMGKIAGALNTNSNGVVDAELGQSIQLYISLLEFTNNEMSNVVGISKQREGQISNRETVGGVERATLQSSHITEWLFIIHEDVKKRVLEAFLENMQIAWKGRCKKLQYITSDGVQKIIEIDGDQFAAADYGLVVDNSDSTQVLNQKLDTLAQAALQNQTLSFGTIMKLYSSASLIEKQRMIEQDENQRMEMMQQERQLQQQQFEQKIQMEQAKYEAEMQQKDTLNARDNETKIMVAEINSQAEAERFAMMNGDGTEIDREHMLQQMQQFMEKMKLDREKLAFEKKKHEEDNALKRELANKQIKSKNSK